MDLEIQTARIESFTLPIFYAYNVITDEECEELIHRCKQSEWADVTRGAFASVNKSWLDDSPYKQRFEIVFGDFARGLMRIEQCKFRIGSSWATKTIQGGFSGLHEHKNYYFSSVLYLTEGARIMFRSPFKDNPNYVFDHVEDNPFNVMTMFLEPPKNAMLLFPSFMEHGIAMHDGNTERYSIAMNFQPYGTFGKHDSIITVK